MNAVEIEEAVADLAAEPFDLVAFPFRFLAAFGMKEVTVKRLRSGASNTSDVPGAVLQRSNIHLAAAPPGQVDAILAALRISPKTAAQKAKFILATDGTTLEAEELSTGEPLACAYADLPQHFGFFLPLAGISTVAEIKNNPIDVKATGRLNKLYVELLKDNPDWATEAKRPALNQFMARLIFCFFASNTGIFHPSYLFTPTVERMSDAQTSDGPGSTHEVIGQLFRAMGMPTKERAAGGFRSWADGFPYVNGGLFTGDGDCPRFSRIARAYLLNAGNLDWKEINPDIFGSMIQAVADDEERGALGMHYTSVPNILKVLNPLFLDDLRAQLEAAGDSVRKLRTLRRRLQAIRVFDPACGSGNFLVIAYLHMRGIEHEMVRRTGDDPKSWIRLDNFYGIEIKGFAAEIARLALLIAEFQADCRYISQQEARMMVLPLHKTGQIHVGNALRLDWLKVCPPVTKTVVEEHDLAGPTGKLALEDNGLSDIVEPDTYICGNPPYLGGKGQSKKQKEDLAIVFYGQNGFGELDFVAGWFFKAVQYLVNGKALAAFVATNSINQGAQVHQLWPKIYSYGVEIKFAYEPFKWSNNATLNAAVICTIIGVGQESGGDKKLFGDGSLRAVRMIGPYLIPNSNVIVHQSLVPICGLPPMITGNSPYDGGHLILTLEERKQLLSRYPHGAPLVRPIYGSGDYISGEGRFCLWISDAALSLAESIADIYKRILSVQKSRLSGGDVAKGLVSKPHRFRYTHTAKRFLAIVPRVSSAAREYLPVGLLADHCIVSDAAQAIYDPEIWVFSILLSKLHIAWVHVIAGRLKSDIRYSSALCYNTFPVPSLTEQNKADLTRCAEDILLAREAHFPAIIADLYDPVAMPDDLRRAHDANDEALERIYIGRRFRNDTERLEKLFELYTKMTAAPQPAKTKAKRIA
jgi:hypothetical protein